MIINKKILALCDIASKDGYRPVLNAIKFEKDRAVATDSYSLMVIPLQQIDPTDLPEISGQVYSPEIDCVINAVEVSEVAKSIKKNNMDLSWAETAWSVASGDDKTVKFFTTDLDTRSYKEVRKVEGNYPEYNKVLDPALEKKAVVEISVNPARLVKMLNAMIKAGASKDGYVTLKVSGALDPLVIKANQGTEEIATGLIMPVRTT